MPADRHACRAGLAAALAIAVLMSGCVCAAAAEAASDGLVLHWGDAAAAAAQGLASLLLPAAIAAATALVARLAGPLRFLITNTLVERLVRNASDYAINAIAGAVRGQTLSVPLGSAVIAKAVQRALEQAPSWLVAAAGGRAGIAEKVFRALPLEEAATAANTLKPALQSARRGTT